MSPIEEFAALVRRLLRQQQNYFRSRDPHDLDAAKKLERLVAAECVRILNPSPRGLFDAKDGDVNG